MTVFDEMVDWRRKAIDNPEYTSPGVYSFWLGKLCIYVGKGNPINRRLFEHWMRKSHVEELHEYFDGFGRKIKLYVRFCDTNAEAFEIEKELIRQFKPKLNRIRFGV
jgi:excinuclease UvrABC nuclease subunit